MEIQGMKQAAIVVGIVAVVVLATLAVLAQYETSLRDDTTTEENVTITSGAGQLTATEEVYSVTSVANASSAGYYILNNISEDIMNVTTQGVVATPLPDDSYTFVYSYLAATSESDAANTFQTGMAIFATFIGILVLAFIGGIIVRLYKGK